jgi:hypothetical protein
MHTIKPPPLQLNVIPELVCVTVIEPDEQLQVIAYAVAELRIAIEVNVLSISFFIYVLIYIDYAIMFWQC